MSLHPALRRYADFLRGRNRRRDPESENLWQDLSIANINGCCNAMRQARNSWNITWLEITNQQKVIQKVQINYCPECGRKL